MKKFMPIVASAAIILGLSVSPHQSEAKTAPVKTSAKQYKNCTEMNKAYQGGVARSSTATNKGGKTKYKPTVNKAIYDSNTKLDRDKDNIACER